MFLLRRLPNVAKENISFQSFRSDGRKEFDECLASVKKHFGNESSVAKEWTEWEKEFIPANDDVVQYARE